MATAFTCSSLGMEKEVKENALRRRATEASFQTATMPDKNTGIPYEKFTKAIFDELHWSQGVEDIEIQHDVQLEGKSTSHQIDLYWSFKMGGVLYHVAVQAKDWASAVTQEKVLAFKAVLDDLKIRATGIMVTRTGYQSGAEDVAKNNGILLYRLSEMTEADWEGRIKTIVFKIHAKSAELVSFEPAFDQVWLKGEFDRLGLPSGQGIPFRMTSDSVIVGADGAKLATVTEVVRAGERDSWLKSGTVDYTHDFGQDAFVLTGDAKIPRLKVAEFRLKFKIHEIVQENRSDGANLVKFVLANLSDGTRHLFDSDQRHFGTRLPESDPGTGQ